MMRLGVHAAIFALVLATGARADGTLLDLRAGTLTYHLVHKLHEVTGTNRAVEGKALVQSDGAARVQIRAKVSGFDSGNSNRDVHMREVTHEALHPYASVRGTLSGVKLPLAAKLETKLAATVELNGEKQSLEVPVELTQVGETVRVHFSFPISLEAFKVDRPELLFVKVDDKVMLDGELSFAAAAAAK